MNVLILNGSPRRHGNVSAMLDAIREEAERNGASVTTVFVPELQVKPCTGCMPAAKLVGAYCPKTEPSRYSPPSTTAMCW